MASALNTILPIFIVIGLGFVIRKKGWLTDAFMSSGNKVLYMVAVPCLLFHKISTAPFHASFSPHLILACAVAIAFMWAGALVLGRFLKLGRGSWATFVQTSIHGNIGYIGLAVCYYSFDDKTFGVAGVLAGFFIIVQNILSITSYHLIADQGAKHRGGMVIKLLINPIILSTFAGLAFSFFQIPLPPIVNKSLMIISKMALPTALLIIGGSLDMGQVFSDIKMSLFSSALKMVGLPLLGVGFFYLFSVPTPLWVVGLVLLSTPSAITCYIMSRELNGDPDLASSTVTTCTLLSLITFVFWLSVSG